MNTHYTTCQASVILKDGNTTLAVWTQPFDQRPQLLDTVKIPAPVLSSLKGFESTALVTSIESGAPLPDRIEVQAVCHVKNQHRPQIVLNSSRISMARRAEAESYVRSSLRFPLIYWETSNASAPVLRYHDPSSGQKTCPAFIHSGLLNLPNQPPAL